MEKQERKRKIETRKAKVTEEIEMDIVEKQDVRKKDIVMK